MCGSDVNTTITLDGPWFWMTHSLLLKQNVVQVFITSAANVFLLEVSPDYPRLLDEQGDVCKLVLNIYRYMVMNTRMEQKTWYDLCEPMSLPLNSCLDFFNLFRFFSIYLFVLYLYQKVHYTGMFLYLVDFDLLFFREQLLVVLLHVTSQTLCGRPTTHKEDSLGGRFAAAFFQVCMPESHFCF